MLDVTLHEEPAFKKLNVEEKAAQYLSGVPDQLRSLPCWGLWQYTEWDEKKGSWGKKNYGNYHLGSPHAFSTFDVALGRLRRGDGDGLSIILDKTPFVCVDVDHIEDMKAAEKLADALGWWELSQSGVGIHALVEDRENTRRKIKLQHDYGAFDVDLLGAGLLFMTGDVYDDVPLEIAALPNVYEELLTLPSGKKKREKTEVVVAEKRGYASVSEAEIRSMFPFLMEDVDNYETFIGYGHALKRWGREDPRGSEAVAFDLWNEWADGCETYAGEDRAEKWASFDVSGDGVTIGTMKHDARLDGWSRREMISGGCLDGDVWLDDGSDTSVFDIIRTSITEALVDRGFDEEDGLPVVWDRIEQAEPRCFADIGGKPCFLGVDGSQVAVAGKYDVKIMDQEFGAFVDWLRVNAFVSELEWLEDPRVSSETKKKALLSGIAGDVMGNFWAAVVRKKTVGAMNMQIDMFATEVLPNVSRNIGTFVLPFAGVSGVVTDVRDDEVVADYKEHNVWFEDILRFVVCSRFAVNRKISYMWLHCESDWGKGLLFDSTGVLGGLGLVFQMSVKEIEKALEGAPVGVDKFAMLEQWVLNVDEFKGVKSELKQLDNQITASPKNMLRFTAPVYAKIFTSAESVASLVGEAGVEDQFAQRFVYLRGRGKLSAREVFRQKGMMRYTGAVREYAREFISSEVSRLVGLGREGAAKEVEGWLRDFHSEHGIKNSFGSLDATIQSEAEDLARVIRRFGECCYSDIADPRKGLRGDDRMVGVPSKVVSVLRDNIQKATWKNEPRGLVTSLGKICSIWMDEMYSKSELGKLTFKRGDMAKMVDEILFPERATDTTKCTHEDGVTKTTKGSLFSVT